MATKPEELERPADVVEAEEEEGGGPVKTFLEHLEDLRWMLIKSVSAILVAMLVCLIGANYLVAILSWPLTHAPQILGKTAKPMVIPVLLGTNVLARLPPEALGLSAGETNQFVLQLLPKSDGTNLVLAGKLEPAPTPPEGRVNSPVLKNYTPLGGIMVGLKLAIYGGIILASPFVLYFVGQFVLPALKIREKSILFRAVAFGSVLFFIGVAFCYFVVAGVALMATVQLSQWMGFGADEWRAEDYITFMCRFMLGMGLAFELPVVILTLVKIELLDYERLVRFRSYAIVGNLVLAAFATPSADPFTMFLMAIPLQFLYEISVIVAWYWRRKDRKQSALAAQTAS
jgi:sec-independent protein translocase protein TatC